MTSKEFLKENMATSALAATLSGEAKELSAIALKFAAVLNNPQFYPESIAECYDALFHNLADVRLVSELMDIEPDTTLIGAKSDAWAKRLGYMPEA